MPKSIPDIFDVEVYGDVAEINQTLSKARCRIFYKYENRNGGYITDEFAEKLISTVPYAPIKGIFDGEAGDFRDHGWERTEGRIYGVVMAEPNFAWEQHTDKDGATRTYACVDVLLFTGLYPQAKLITGKPQSMELYPPSIKGEWKSMGGPYEYYVYEDACFLGLQVLGDDVEPCFEGASFYSLVNSVAELVEEIKKFNLASQQNLGGNTMENLENSVVGGLNDPILDEAADEAANKDEENVDEVDNTTEDNDATDADDSNEDDADVDEDESDDESDDDATDNEESEDSEEDEASDDEEDESADDEGSDEGSDEGADEGSDASDEGSEENFEVLEQKIVESEQTIATLTTENETLTAQVNALNAEVETLRQFKLEVENAQKNEVINSYVELLDTTILDAYKEKISEYASAESLDKDLAYELKKSNTGVFSKGPAVDSGFVPSGDPEVTGITAILEKYQNK